MIPIPAAKVEAPAKREPIVACIGTNLSITKCGRDVETREYIFTNADYAVAHYDRRTRSIPATALAACPKCIDARKKELAEDAAARAK
jgi:hypothetical protein